MSVIRYHICIVHTYQWWVLGQSTLQVFVNGVLQEQGPLKYPNTGNVIPLFTFVLFIYSCFIYFIIFIRPSRCVIWERQ